MATGLFSSFGCGCGCGFGDVSGCGCVSDFGCGGLWMVIGFVGFFSAAAAAGFCGFPAVPCFVGDRGTLLAPLPPFCFLFPVFACCRSGVDGARGAGCSGDVAGAGTAGAAAVAVCDTSPARRIESFFFGVEAAWEGLDSTAQSTGNGGRAAAVAVAASSSVGTMRLLAMLQVDERFHAVSRQHSQTQQRKRERKALTRHLPFFVFAGFALFSLLDVEMERTIVRHIAIILPSREHIGTAYENLVGDAWLLLWRTRGFFV